MTNENLRNKLVVGAKRGKTGNQCKARENPQPELSVEKM